MISYKTLRTAALGLTTLFAPLQSANAQSVGESLSESQAQCVEQAMREVFGDKPNATHLAERRKNPVTGQIDYLSVVHGTGWLPEHPKRSEHGHVYLEEGKLLIITFNLSAVGEGSDDFRAKTDLTTGEQWIMPGTDAEPQIMEQGESDHERAIIRVGFCLLPAS